jgi:hypothetical protein
MLKWWWQRLLARHRLWKAEQEGDEFMIFWARMGVAKYEKNRP